MLIQFIPCSHACTFNSEGGSIGPLLPKMSWSILFLWLNEPHMHQNTTVLQTYYNTFCFCGSVSRTCNKTPKKQQTFHATVCCCCSMSRTCNKTHQKKNAEQPTFCPQVLRLHAIWKLHYPVASLPPTGITASRHKATLAATLRFFFQPHLSGNGALGISFFWLLWSGLGAGSWRRPLHRHPGSCLRLGWQLGRCSSWALHTFLLISILVLLLWSLCRFFPMNSTISHPSFSLRSSLLFCLAPGDATHPRVSQKRSLQWSQRCCFRVSICHHPPCRLQSSSNLSVPPSYPEPLLSWALKSPQGWVQVELAKPMEVCLEVAGLARPGNGGNAALCCELPLWKKVEPMPICIWFICMAICMKKGFTKAAAGAPWTWCCTRSNALLPLSGTVAINCRRSSMVTPSGNLAAGLSSP